MCRKFAIGQVFLVFIFAPTGKGLSVFRTATRSGFERCNKISNLFHILDSLQLILAIDNTKRVLFCTNPEVDFEFFGYITFRNTFDGSATALSFKLHRNFIEFNGEKIANGLLGCTDNPHRLVPIKKRTNRWPVLSQNFSTTRVPRWATIKSYRGRALHSAFRRITRWIAGFWAFGGFRLANSDKFNWPCGRVCPALTKSEGPSYERIYQDVCASEWKTFTIRNSVRQLHKFASIIPIESHRFLNKFTNLNFRCLCRYCETTDFASRVWVGVERDTPEERWASASSADALWLTLLLNEIYTISFKHSTIQTTRSM